MVKKKILIDTLIVMCIIMCDIEVWNKILDKWFLVTFMCNCSLNFLCVILMTKFTTFAYSLLGILIGDLTFCCKWDLSFHLLLDHCSTNGHLLLLLSWLLNSWSLSHQAVVRKESKRKGDSKMNFTWVNFIG